jgi:molecular chaperone DnaK
MIQGLAPVAGPNQILVRLDLDLNGILRVTATERATGLARQVVIDNMMERFRRRERVDALERLEELFAEPSPAGQAEHWRDDDEEYDDLPDDVIDISIGGASAHEVADPALREAIRAAESLLAKAPGLEAAAPTEDAAELKAMQSDLRSAISRRSLNDIERICAEMEDLVFYLQDQ